MCERPLMPRPEHPLMQNSGRFRGTRWCHSQCSCEGASMADLEVLSRAAEVDEQFRPIELTAETVTRPAGPHTLAGTCSIRRAVEVVVAGEG